MGFIKVVLSLQGLKIKVYPAGDFSELILTCL